MPLNSLDKYIIDDVKHARLWKDAIIVFDASSLLDMYFYSDKTKKVVIDEIFKKLQGRLWIPYQVNYEFLKNRAKVILKPIGSYTNLEEELKNIATSLKKCQIGISELKSKTKKEDKHPVLDQHVFVELDQSQQHYETALKELSDKIKEIIKSRTEEIKQTVDCDILYNAIDSYFEVGAEFSFSDQMALVKEGKMRYEFKIPPGFEDFGANKKEGTQIFGDLFIWKELINHAKAEKKPIIYISNDVKPDWCVKNESNSTYIENPRHELIKEFWDAAGCEFWMYSNPQLLYNATKYLKSEIAVEQIKEVNAVANQREENKDNAPTCVFTWPVDEKTNSGGTKPMEKSLMYLLGSNNKPLTVDWGDDSPREVVSTRNVIFHDYPEFGEYIVRIYGDIFWFCAMGISSPERGIQYPKVSEASFTNPVYLERFQCFAGKLKEVDLKKMLNLTQLLVGSNEIENLDLLPLRKLMWLFCENNRLTDLDLSQNLFLSKMDCGSNQLTNLDLSNNNILESLKCVSNQLTSIELNNNNNLTELNCAYNKLNEESLNSIFNDLPFVLKGTICIFGNPGADSCNKIIATTKGWDFEDNPYYRLQSL